MHLGPFEVMEIVGTKLAVIDFCAIQPKLSVASTVYPEIPAATYVTLVDEDTGPAVQV